MSNCKKCNEFKSLVGTYTHKGTIYGFKACPRCYPARANVINALNRLVAEMVLSGNL